MNTLLLLFSGALASKLKCLHGPLTVVTHLLLNTQDGTIQEKGVPKGIQKYNFTAFMSFL